MQGEADQADRAAPAAPPTPPSPAYATARGYRLAIEKNLARGMGGSLWQFLGRHGWHLALFVVTPLIVFLPMAKGFDLLRALSPSLSAPPNIPDFAASLGEALCTGAAFIEERLIWGASACLSLVSCLAVIAFAGFSIAPYVGRGRAIWLVFGTIAVVTVLVLIGMHFDGRIFKRVFPDYFVTALETWSCKGEGGTAEALHLYAVFNAYFDVINAVSVAMCVVVALSLALTITNVKPEGDIGFVRRQIARYRSLLYLGSIVLVVGIWHMQTWSAWPVAIFEDLKSRAEKKEAADKAKAEAADARLREMTATLDEEALRAKKISEEHIKRAREAFEKQESLRPKLVEERDGLRRSQTASAEAKAEWERRKAAAVSTSKGFLAYFGSLYTLLLIVLFVPAWALLDRAIRVRAVADAQAARKSVDAWLSENGLTFNFVNQLKPILAFVGPLVAATVGTALTSLLNA